MKAIPNLSISTTPYLGPELEGLLGRPVSGQVVIFPVLGAERMISLIYTDNGQRDEEIQGHQDSRIGDVPGRGRLRG